MSGHSKWATTKRAKAVVDAKRAGAFTKIANLITIAAREKGGDVETNFSLRLAVEKAKAINMPKDNIERAIKRGLGTLEGEILEEIRYEGYGPGGCAFIIDVLTNSRNRSSSEIKHLFSKYGGSLGAQNSVSWMFEKKGLIGIPDTSLSEELELSLIEAGARDIQGSEEGSTITAEPENFSRLKAAVESLGITPAFAEIDTIPKTPIQLDANARAAVEKFVEELDDRNDVTAYYSNCD